MPKHVRHVTHILSAPQAILEQIADILANAKSVKKCITHFTVVHFVLAVAPSLSETWGREQLSKN
jgi:hypothetical protein